MIRVSALVLLFLLAGCTPYPDNPDSMIAQGLALRTSTARAGEQFRQATADVRQATRDAQNAITFELSAQSTHVAMIASGTAQALSQQETAVAIQSMKATQTQAVILNADRRRAEQAALAAASAQAQARAGWDTFWQAILKLFAAGLMCVLVMFAGMFAWARVMVYRELNSILVEDRTVIIPRHVGRVRYNLVAHLDEPVDAMPRLSARDPVVVTTPAMEPDRKEVLSFLARSIRKVGDDATQIPSDDVLGAKTHEWKAVVRWLKEADVIYTIPSSGTFIKSEFGNLGDIFVGVQEGAIGPHPTPLPDGWLRTDNTRTHGNARR